MSSTAEILSFEIVIDAKLSDETKKNLEELKVAAEKPGGAPADISGEEAVEIEETVTEQDAAERLEEFIKTTDREGMKNLSSFAKNPSSMVQGQLMKVLGRAGIHGAIAVAIIAIIISTPEIISTIVSALAVKGGPLNQDFHLFFEDQQQLGLERDLQFRYATGLDIIITNYQRGYLLTDPGFVGNNLVDIDISRSFRLTTPDTQYGYVRSL